jgi:hypothetical protein
MTGATSALGARVKVAGDLWHGKDPAGSVAEILGGAAR